MRILNEYIPDDCVGQALIRDIEVSEPVTREVIEQMGRQGKLEYHQGFLRPLYQLEVEGRFWLKGIEGKTRMKVILCRDRLEEALEEARCLIEGLEPAESGSTQRKPHSRQSSTDICSHST